MGDQFIEFDLPGRVADHVFGEPPQQGWTLAGGGFVDCRSNGGGVDSGEAHGLLGGLDQFHHVLGVVVAEQVDVIDVAKRPATTEIPFGDLAVIESDGNEPGSTGRTQAEFLCSERDLFILITLGLAGGFGREACEEGQ